MGKVVRMAPAHSGAVRQIRRERSRQRAAQNLALMSKRIRVGRPGQWLLSGTTMDEGLATVRPLACTTSTRESAEMPNHKKPG